MRWYCDNWASCKIVEYGSVKPDCHRVVIRIDDLVRGLEVDLEIVWQSRETEYQRILTSGAIGSCGFLTGPAA